MLQVHQATSTFEFFDSPVNITNWDQEEIVHAFPGSTYLFTVIEPDGKRYVRAMTNSENRSQFTDAAINAMNAHNLSSERCLIIHGALAIENLRLVLPKIAG